MGKEKGMADNGVQDKEKEEVEFPQSWEKLVEEDPLLGALPELKPADGFTFAEASRFNVMRARLMGTYALQDGMKADSVDAVVDAVEARNKAVMEALDFYKSITADPDAVDAFTVGVGVDVLFLLLIDVTVFYVNALGKSVASKASSTGTKQS